MADTTLDAVVIGGEFIDHFDQVMLASVRSRAT
jgi:hypothetical protein